ncbi:MAG: M48 family metallopeptidase [Treponema sp.]|nr:M48 family metallopeptidase [Treponema sp.]
MSIGIMPDGSLLVKVPYGISEASVKEFILLKKGWIEKHLKKQECEKQKAKSLGLLSEQDVRRIRKDAKKIIPERVEFWAKKLGVTYGRISIRLQSSRWGSCAQSGNLNFNCLLVIMPSDVLDSVVVHELCHRRHMNHSKEFYAEVEGVFPNYKACDKWLKENGGVYMKRVYAENNNT